VKRLLALAALAACGTPPLKIVLALPQDGSCGSDDCGGVTMSCDAVVSIRIVDPNNENQPFDSKCEPVDTDTNNTLCPISGPNLDDIPLPEETLEVQIAVYPADSDQIQYDHGKPICPTDVQYTYETNMPIGDTVAVGGRAYYHPGDDEVVVTLGCPNLQQLVCSQLPTTFVSTQVLDFSDGIAISDDDAQNLDVYVGAPTIISNGYALPQGPGLQALTYRGSNGAYTQNVTVMFDPEGDACVDVYRTVGRSTSVVTCVPSAQVTSLIRSWYAPDATLAPIFTAAGLDDVPDAGIVVGQVVDNGHRAVAGMRVIPSSGTVHYVTSDGHIVDDATTDTGLFYSLDAPYMTTFTTSDSHSTVSTTAGLIEGKVAIAVLQLDHAVNP